ncbi:MAG: hypothetical protein KatS3mg061_1474 [Dehalococcoidia bacterium]|nr:MAG: hypothetical protein KatS3mg061_1474 [Dehalococcoidia bacterium]
MEGIEEVRQLSDNRLFWRAQLAEKEKMWTARITEQIPDLRIAWTAESGAPNAGVVTFHYLEPQKTRVTLQMTYDPEGLIENVGDALGVAKRRIEGTSSAARSSSKHVARKLAPGAGKSGVPIRLSFRFPLEPSARLPRGAACRMMGGDGPPYG